MYKTDINALLKELDSKPVTTDRLVTDCPTPNTLRLYRFLTEIRGKKFIAGQQYLFEDEYEDLVYFKVSGKLPALRGYDFMGISGLGGGYDQINRALDWARSTGGILTMCWHWYAPDDMSDFNKGSSFYYKTTGYSHKTSFDIIRAVSDGTAENEFVLREIDLVAEALRQFEREDIPVIWRPLHEANGNWFWWGNRGKDSVEAYKKLWYIIFDRFMNLHKLKNLIWVWNGQDKEMAVHPNTFDIVGDDIYTDPPAHISHSARFKALSELSAGKPLALSECGSIPEPDEMQRDGAEWLWWLPWWGQFVYTPAKNGLPALDEEGLPTINPAYMDEDFLKRVMNDERVVTLDKLPWRDSRKHGLPSMLKKHLSEM
ncbi:MAG: glycosyl hydrolase [Oscillospiraceae bacterium]